MKTWKPVLIAATLASVPAFYLRHILLLHWPFGLGFLYEDLIHSAAAIAVFSLFWFHLADKKIGGGQRRLSIFFRPFFAFCAVVLIFGAAAILFGVTQVLIGQKLEMSLSSADNLVILHVLVAFTLTLFGPGLARSVLQGLHVETGGEGDGALRNFPRLFLVSLLVVAMSTVLASGLNLLIAPLIDALGGAVSYLFTTSAPGSPEAPVPEAQTFQSLVTIFLGSLRNHLGSSISAFLLMALCLGRFYQEVAGSTEGGALDQ